MLPITDLSAFKRVTTLEKAEKQLYDVIIIGGGITGAGIALDAASRGLKTILVEKHDFASGTSSRSTKLIHGGLRYLKQFDFKLVREVGSERKILYKNASHIVYPEKMLLPLIKGGTFGKLATSFGLWLYDRLAKVSKEERRLMLSKKETLEKEPLLNSKLLVGSGLYAEYRTDDARLTVEVVKTACNHGADCINYAEATELVYNEKKKVKGIIINDLIENKAYKIHSKYIINATGPWVEELIKKDDISKSNILYHTKGVHIVIPFKKLPLNQSAYFDAEGGRMIFAIPRSEMIYIGTTDTFYSSDLNDPKVTKEDVSYLLNAVNRMFPEVKLTKDDIVSGWAGIRPLIAQEGKSPSEISRKDEIFLSDSGLITIAGGKLTGYRKMGEKVVDKVMTDIAQTSIVKFVKCKTKDLKLSGGNFEDPGAINKYIQSKTKETNSLGFSENDISSLVYKYGTSVDNILDIVKKDKLKEDKKSLLLKAELEYCINYEGVTNISDFLIRRTGMLYFNTKEINSILQKVTTELSRLLNWNEETQKKYLDQFISEYKNAGSFE